MYQQDYNSYPSQQQTPQPLSSRMPYLPPQQSGIVLRMAQPVSSFEEVKAMSINFDGSIFFFPDLASKRVYSKQILQDGTPNYKVYEEKALPNINMASSYVTREEYENTLLNLQKTLNGIMNTVQNQPQSQNQTQQPQEQISLNQGEVKPF